MSKILVLGAGLVGSAIAKDLVKKHEVMVIDVNTDIFPELKNQGIQCRQADLSVSGRFPVSWATVRRPMQNW